MEFYPFNFTQQKNQIEVLDWEISAEMSVLTTRRDCTLDLADFFFDFQFNSKWFKVATVIILFWLLLLLFPITNDLKGSNTDKVHLNQHPGKCQFEFVDFTIKTFSYLWKLNQAEFLRWDAIHLCIVYMSSRKIHTSYLFSFLFFSSLSFFSCCPSKRFSFNFPSFPTTKQKNHAH